MLARLAPSLLLAWLGCAAAVSGQSLDGTWDLIPATRNQTVVPVEQLAADDGLVLGTEHVHGPGLPTPVPGAWEAAPWWHGTPGPGEPGDVGLSGDGLLWYRRLLPEPDPLPPGWRRELQFDAVNDRADVWLDGVHLGRHEGSDSPFAFDVTDRALAAGQALVVRVVDPGHEPVDGIVLGARPHAKESWYHNYGGITGSVRLAVVPPVEARLPDLLWDGGDTAHLRLDLLNRTPLDQPTTVSARLAGGDLVSVTQVVAPGRSEVVLELSVAGLAPWTPEDPARHELLLTTAAAGVDHERRQLLGLRRFTVRDGRFELNGVPRVLRGVLYQPFFPVGLCDPPTESFLRDELAAIKAAGFDLVRAHIRVMPRVYALCDELGLLVQAEPTLGWITSLRPTTLPLVDQALVTLADAVRGHPSVVMAGLLNELSGELFPHTAALFARLHELLPGHLLLDDSGSWQGTAHLWNPGADEPVPCDDLHVYRAWPWEPKDLAFAAGLGADHERLVFVSEVGFGGMPSFDAAVAGYDGLHGSPDAAEALADREQALAELASGRLDGLADDLESLAALGQRNQARALEVMVAALAANPRVAGTVVTQWRDASWENGAGLVDLWAGPKPALAALSRLNGLGSRPTLDDVARPAAPPPRERRPLARLALPPGHDVPPGLDEHQRAALDGLVLEPGAADAAALPALALCGRVASPWGAEQQTTTLTLLRWVKDGGVLLWLDAPDAGRPLDAFLFGYDGLGRVADLPVDLSARSSRGHFVGTHQVVRQGSPLLADLGLPERLLDERLGTVAPHRVLFPHDVSGGVRSELACLDGYGRLRGASVLVQPFGAGALVLSTLRFTEEGLADPFGRRLFENLVGLAAAEAAAREPGPPPAPVDIDPQLAKDVGRMVWRAKVRYGQAERFAVQTLNGVRTVRHELPGQAQEARRLVGMLRRLVAGPTAGDGLDPGLGRAVADLADRPALDEAFLRKELELSRAFYRPQASDPAPRELAGTLAIGRAHAAALSFQREGRPDQALAALERALALTRALDGDG